MHVVAGEGLTVHGRFVLSEHHQGAPGLAHGGLIALAMDEVLGGLGWLLQTPMVTGRLQVEYLRPAPIGTMLDLDAEVAGVCGRRIFCRGAARVAPDGDGREEGPGPMLARAHAVFVAVPLEHFRTHGRTDEVDAAAERASGHAPSVAERGWQVNP
jgi:acyl-coenzyme A thioesterase PaaI-like protein